MSSPLTAHCYVVVLTPTVCHDACGLRITPTLAWCSPAVATIVSCAHRRGQLGQDEADADADGALRVIHNLLHQESDPSVHELLLAMQRNVVFGQVRRALDFADHFAALELLMRLDNPTIMCETWPWPSYFPASRLSPRYLRRFVSGISHRSRTGKRPRIRI